MRNKLILAAALTVLAAAPLSAQRQAPEVRQFGGTGGNATLANMVVAGNTVYLSGVVGNGDNIEAATRSAMDGVRNRLAQVGATMDDVVKCLVMMADLSQRPQLNPIYSSYFPNTKPARSAIGVDLGGPLVEVECIAYLPEYPGRVIGE
jgi:2-iminobutanoate/2-iminopropanoate deaminase